MPVTTYISVNGRMLSEVTDGVILDYVPDALGSIHSVVDKTATAVKTMRYNPYGEVLSRSGSISDRMYQWVGHDGWCIFGSMRVYKCPNTLKECLQ